MDSTQTYAGYQRSNSEQLEVNGKLFTAIRETNISIEAKLEKFKKLLTQSPQPDINAQDGNDNCNTALHLAVKRNELEVVNFLLSKGADTGITNGDGKTPLQLAVGCNYTEIIDALESYNSQVQRRPSETDKLASHTSQPVAANRNVILLLLLSLCTLLFAIAFSLGDSELSVFHSNSPTAATDEQTSSTVLPPFSGKLRVDKELKWSHDYFKQSIVKFHENKQISAIDQLTATPPYPTSHVLAQFANMAYADYNHKEPKPPNGWQLLTTASNFGNGYFGTAYWHQEHQQVVIAHRGTEGINLEIFTDINKVVAFFKDLSTDIEVVLHNNYVDQMSSASTFANKVLSVLQEIEQEKKVSFELFFTGHSLGGWLAQITTFTTEYLEVKGGTFLKKLKREEQETLVSSTVQDSHEVRKGYHPHTVVFDSPGGKDMLSQMAEKLDVRLHGSSIDLQHLDISSYLSAPNLINTCNSHLGTVYRIFTDLSEMGWEEKHTPLFNLATHKLGKIVEAFDPETGQVCKDDQGRLKIQEVVDWPVSAGLEYGAELNDFFKWAEHLNNYHPEVMDISHSKVPKAYDLLRYQTKTYDERTKSLRVFSYDERELLESYRWLREVAEFFKPKDLFCVINNVEAEKEAEQKLQNFEIDNDRIICPDASTLHTVIPYVRRLVRLFPQIKDKAKDQLSSTQIRNRVYQHETQCYAKNIDQSAIDFNPNSLGLREFLDSDQLVWHLRMVDGDAWTGIIKVYRVLQKTFCTLNYSSEGHYTIMDSERLTTVNRMINLNALLTSIETPHLLMIACGTNQTVNEELESMFRGMFNILKQNTAMKVILTTQTESNIASFIHQIATETFGTRFSTTDEQLTWSDLTASSQRKILEKKVIFQGRPVALNQLTFAESVTDSFPLADLLYDKVLRIGEGSVPSGSSGYNEEYYIDRTFNHNIVIREDILSDERDGKCADLLANGEESVQSGSSEYNEEQNIGRTSKHKIVVGHDILSDKEGVKLYDLLGSTEQEFKHLCQRNPNRNVHWLEKHTSGELVWQQSKGDLKTLRKYIDNHKSHSYPPNDLDKLLQQAKLHRVMLIADKAGIGKSTVLSHLSKRIKQISPANWSVKIDLKDYTELLKAQKGKKMNKERVLEFLSKEVLQLESDLEKELFKKCFEGNEINKVVVMVDGFDEISPNYKQTVIDMLQVLKQTTSLEQLWVTTRPHLREELEDNLQQLSYTLQPFSEDEQIEFLKKFWLKTSNLEVKDQQRLQIYAEALIRKFAQSISDKDKQLTGIPLQTRMLAEAFGGEFRLFYLSEKSQPELPHRLELLGLYKRFIDNKYNIYYLEKAKIPEGNLAAEEQRKRYFKILHLEHQKLALEATFTEDHVKSLQINYLSTLSAEDLARLGIVQRDSEGKPQFIHRTLAEYFVAEFLINQMTKETKQHTKLQDILLNEVLLQTNYEIIRAFLDGLLEKNPPSVEALKGFGEKLDKQWNDRAVLRTVRDGTTAIHQAAEEDNAHIVGFLLDSLKSGEHSTAIRMMLLATGRWGETAVHLAAGRSSVQALKKIWEWAEAVTPTLTYILIMSQDIEGKTAWLLAAERGHVKVVEKLWNWAKEEQIEPGGLQNKLLLGHDLEGRTAWHAAAQSGSVELTDKLWSWAKELLPSSDLLKNKLLLSRDKNGINAWHLAAKTGNVVILGKLWEWAKELQLEPEELRNELWLSKDKSGQTAWQMAAEGGHIEVLERLWEWAKELQLEPDELRNELWLSKDKSGQTAWHMAAEGGHIEVLERLWEWAKEEELNPDYLKSALFVSEDSRGFSSWRCAVYNGHIYVIEKLWGWAEEMQLTTNELNKLILAEDKCGNTAIYWAACTGRVELLDKLWAVCKKNQLNPDGLSKLLVASWHKAAARGYIEILERMWLWAGEEQLNTQELQRRLLLENNKNASSGWHMAAAGGHVDVLEKLWDWAGEVQLNREELKDKFLLNEHQDGKFAFHLTVKGEYEEVSDNLIGSPEVAQINADDIRSAMLLARDKNGETAWQLAIRNERVVLSEKLLDWAKDMQLNLGEVRNKLLLDQEENGRHAWFMAAKSGNVKLLEELWALAKEKGNREEIKSKLLLAQNEYGQTALHVAAEGSVAVLEKMWAFAKEVELNKEELKNQLLLAKDKNGNTVWHGAAEGGSLEALEMLWDWAKEVELNADEILMAQNEKRETVYHLAAERKDEGILEEMWGFARESRGNTKEITKTFLLVKDKTGNTVWHRAAKGGSLEALEMLWNWVKEVQINTDDLLLDKEKHQKYPSEIVTQTNKLGVSEEMRVEVQEAKIYKEEITRKLILSEDLLGRTAWHLGASLGNSKVLETLWTWAKEEEINTDELLLAQNWKGCTAFLLAAENNNVEKIKRIWDWAEEKQINSNELKKNLLLTKDIDGYMAWHRAAKQGSLEALETLWSWANEMELNTDELLLAKNILGHTAFQLATASSNVETINRMWLWAEQKQLNPNELKKKLFLSKDIHGNMAWHRAVIGGSLEALETLWSLAKEMELNTDELLLEQTPFHLAAEKNRVEILKRMWVWAEETQHNANEFKKKMFLSKDIHGNMAWHRAVIGGSLEALEILFSLAKEMELNADELLLEKTKVGYTAFLLAAWNNNVEIINIIWIWAEETQLIPNELKKKLFLSKDIFGCMAWHIAAFGGSLEALETLWSLAKETELNTDELLLAQTMDGYTAFLLAAENNNVEILNKVWGWAEETQLNPNELKKKLFLSKDKFGCMAWHIAAFGGSLAALETLWSLAKEMELNTDEMLLAKTMDGYTAFLLAAEKNNVEILNKIWVWAEETFIKPNDIMKNLFLSKDIHGNMAWHRAVFGGSLDALETLWIWANGMEINTDELLIAQNMDGYTAFILAAENNNIEILNEIWVWAEQTQINPNELKKILFLSKDVHGCMAWHRAAIGGSLEALESLWNLAKEMELNTEELLLAKSMDGYTAFILAAEKNRVETLKKIWVWAEETQLNPNELKNKLFLSKELYGCMAWHRAAIGGSLESLETLWSLANEIELNTDELLLAKSVDGHTAFQLAAERNHVETLKKMWVWAEEKQLNPNELKERLFLSKDLHGNMAWNLAVNGGSLEALEALWIFAKEIELNTDELLLAQTTDGYTTFQLAAEKTM